MHFTFKPRFERFSNLGLKFKLRFKELMFAWLAIQGASEKNIMQSLTYAEVDMKCYGTVNFILTDANRRSICLTVLGSVHN